MAAWSKRPIAATSCIDPDFEIITATQVSPGNAGDASVAEDLIAELLHEPATPVDVEDDGATGSPGAADPADAADDAGPMRPMCVGRCRRWSCW